MKNEDIDIALDNCTGRAFAELVNAYLKSQGHAVGKVAVIEVRRWVGSTVGAAERIASSVPDCQTVRIGRRIHEVCPRDYINFEAPHANAVIGWVTTTTVLISCSWSMPRHKYS